MASSISIDYPSLLESHFPMMKIGECIGGGSYGVVYRCEEKTRSVAVKIIRKSEVALKEISFSKALGSHPHIVSLLSSLETEEFVFLVFDFCAGGDLYEYLCSRRFSASEASRLFLQLLDAMQYAHNQGIYHSDLKPENILIDANGQLKVCDFGLATNERIEDSGFYGNVMYAAPEMFLSTYDYDASKADVWALGLIFLNMLSNQPIWARATVDDTVYARYLKSHHNFMSGHGLSLSLINLFRGIFVVDPAHRLSVAELKTATAVLLEDLTNGPVLDLDDSELDCSALPEFAEMNDDQTEDSEELDFSSLPAFAEVLDHDAEELDYSSLPAFEEVLDTQSEPTVSAPSISDPTDQMVLMFFICLAKITVEDSPKTLKTSNSVAMKMLIIDDAPKKIDFSESWSVVPLAV